jgi:hypothetical protein
MSSPSPLAMALEGKAPEVGVSRDMIRRGLLVAPLVIAACGALWGMKGAASGAFGLALVLVNFALSAATVAVSARISLAVMMGAILVGYLVRLGLITVAVLLVADHGWVSPAALGATIIVTHLGLLVWELKFVAASLAFPGLRPRESAVAFQERHSDRQHSVSDDGGRTDGQSRLKGPQ